MRRTLQALSFLSLVSLLTLTAPDPALAQLERAGVVTTLQGTATVVRAATTQPIPLKFRDDVFLRDRITTGDNSAARILLGGKAIVTVRERSVLTISELPGTSTIEVGLGRIALAVAKERMRAGESIEIRTPNAVAGIRGTVVIAEVSQATAQARPAPGAFTTTITVLRGAIEFFPRDPASGRLGAAVNLRANQTIGVTGSVPRPPQTLSPEAVKRLSSDFKLGMKGEPSVATATVKAQVEEVVKRAEILDRSERPRKTHEPRPARDDDDDDNDGRVKRGSRDSGGAANGSRGGTGNGGSTGGGSAAGVSGAGNAGSIGSGGASGGGGAAVGGGGSAASGGVSGGKSGGFSGPAAPSGSREAVRLRGDDLKHREFEKRKRK